MISLLELFVGIDDFCQVFLSFKEGKFPAEGSKNRRRAEQLSIGEIMMIIIHFIGLITGTSRPITQIMRAST